MNVLFLGDLVGETTISFLKKNLPNIKKKYNLSFVIVNGENLANGYGITPAMCDRLFEIGINVISSGNHIWDQEKIIPYIAKQKKLLRPINYSENAPGNGLGVFKDRQGKKIVVVNIQCNLFMQKANNAFSEVKKILEKIKLKISCDAIFIDLHGEVASEKQAFANMLDGKVTAVMGTHTHVPTSDLRVLPNGTAFQTDTGMCGDYDSVIGMNKENSLNRFMKKDSVKHFPAKGDASLSGVIVDCNVETGLATKVRSYIFGGHLKNIN